MRTLTLDLLDEHRDCRYAIEAALFVAPSPLGEVTTTGPGAYVLLYRGDLSIYDRLRRPHWRDYRSMSEAGGAPIYVGSAMSLRERSRRHEINMRPCTDITAADLLVVELPTQTEAGALYVERLLMDAFCPVWNQPFVSGFGSKRQGVSRTRHQRVPRWSVLHPGRHQLAGMDHETQRRTLQQSVVSYLESSVADPFSIALPAREMAEVSA